MRTPTLFAVALASLLISFSDAAALGALNKRLAPVDGMLNSVVTSGGTGTGNLVSTAAGLVTPPPPSSANKKRALGLVSDILGDNGSTGATVGTAGVSGGSRVREGYDDRHGDRLDDEITKRSNEMKKRGLLDGVLGGEQSATKAASTNDWSGKGGKSAGKPAAKASKEKTGGLLGGVPVVDGLLKRDVLSANGIPLVDGLLGNGKPEKNVAKQAATTNGKGRSSSKGKGKGGSKSAAKTQPGKAKEGGLLGGLPLVDGLLR